MNDLLTDEQLDALRWDLGKKEPCDAKADGNALLAHIDALTVQRDEARATAAVMREALEPFARAVSPTLRQVRHARVVLFADAARLAADVLGAAATWRNAMATGNSGAISAAAGDLIDAIDAWKAVRG